MKKPLVRVLGTINVFSISGPGVVQNDRAEALRTAAGAPPDMLRYDHAFQNWDACPGVIVIPTYSVRGGGRFHGKATKARWASFSVNIEPAPVAIVEAVHASIRNNPEQWCTSRFPRDTYQRLESCTWRTFFTEEVK